MTTNHRDGEREAIEELLPWYATGKLSGSERKRVEDYLERNPDVRRGLIAAKEEVAITTAANEALGGPDPEGLKRLMQALPAQHRAVAAPKTPSVFERLAHWLAELQPAQLGLAAAALITLLVGQAVTIGTLVGTRPGVYQTATGPTERPAANSVELLIGFKPEATMADTTAFLKDNGLTVIDGPRGGLFRVRGPAGAGSLADEIKSSAIVATVLPGR